MDKIASCPTKLFSRECKSGELTSLADICYTAGLRRSHHEKYRLAFIVHSTAELQVQLAAFLAGTDPQPSGDIETDALTAQVQDIELRQAALRGQEPERTNFLTAFGQLYRWGHPVDWSLLYPAENAWRRSAVCRLPSYPWQRRRYWHESDSSRAARLGQAETQTENAPEVAYPLQDVKRYPFLQQLKNTPVSERRLLLVDHLRAQVAEVLGLDSPAALDVQQGFFDLGMSSLQAITLGANLKASLGISLPSTSAFRYPNIGALADYLQTALPLDFPAPAGHASNGRERPGPWPVTPLQDLGAWLDETDDEETLLNLLLQSLNNVENQKPV